MAQPGTPAILSERRWVTLLVPHYRTELLLPGAQR
jgi:hypothetical protein